MNTVYDVPTEGDTKSPVMTFGASMCKTYDTTFCVAPFTLGGKDVPISRDA